MKNVAFLALSMFAASAFGVSSVSAADPVDLKVGDAAPVFHASDDTGAAWKSTDHVGKKIVVVYFYPADFTGGCTKQACGFRDDMAKLSGKDVEVVGVSGDTVKTHAAFKKAHNLNFALLADGDGKVAEKFGVPCALGEKTAKGTVDGKEEAFVRTATISRWTFVIDKKGKIASKNSTVKAAEDSKAILELIETLK
ncbi:MAG: peroxiredoxin [Planctomycetaceae bacterium]